MPIQRITDLFSHGFVNSAGLPIMRTGVWTGVARGCGRQELGAYINLCTFYVIGVPTALVLAFYFNLDGRVSLSIQT